ncbi:Rpn family recombination-promoting nuclease/putative transposase [Nocardia vinacea]|uniref:Rpn family recombination-promoting nuclease/putative transposase n=1 Tax=Nocardia vinacea TaxID=96468 RepID=UPI0002E4F92A|nr:Rpn family recombination-promoting nuclease/putative transposase [Nocardia vinacea]
MAANPSNPHDAYFRNVLGRPAEAASELRLVLPREIVARLDWATLEVQSGTFVSDELRSRQSDLLFRTRLDGHDAFVYILLEHQSRSDNLMPFRMLEYIVSIWNHYLRAQPDARSLPPIIPVVVHVGPTGCRWTAPMDVAELIDVDADTRAALGDCMPRLRYILDDINAVDLPALLRRPLTPAAKVMLFLQKTASGNTDLVAQLLLLHPELRAIIAGPGGKQDFRIIVKYIMLVGDMNPDDLDPLADQLGHEAKDVIVTTADRLRAEGRAEGEARGEARWRAATLIEQLTFKFGRLPASVEQAVRDGGLEQLKLWSARVLTASSLDDVLA